MANLADKKEVIKDYIRNRTMNVVNDARAYLFIRHKPDIDIDKIGIGGGNLTTALALFATLGFLAKVYKILEKGFPYTQNEINEARDALKNCPGCSSYENLIIPRRANELNEENAFISLIRDSKVNLGIKDDELCTVWREVRNKLAHMNVPDKGNVIMTFKIMGKSYEEIIDLIEKSETPPFLRNENNDLEMYADILQRDVVRISKWIAEQIDSNQFKDDKIILALDWLSS
jgi:hypothetical protein